ncbi:alpha/beta hydrolase [Alicyclobacillus tolerans]|uniref:alpha/beta fold hydrolase n=1 Tax=Alicyclobacillus tolerans TaxID=90970 RepID=UPI001F2C3FEF|nr:alpha/beta hydrolase [Alicyclobacillus tolerans]MCF8567655.1 alpha/beta hydrolase [Alicyclobacillus tolerans]
MPKVRVRDIEMYYEEGGTGPALLLIMGLSGNLDWWGQPFLSDLEQHFRVIRFDNRGAGRTDRPAVPYSISGFADDTVGLMDALSLEKAHVMGVSMGGMIAQELAVNEPQRVDKLVLGCTNCGPSHSVMAGPEVQAMLVQRPSSLDEVKANTLRLLFPEDFITANGAAMEANWREITKAPIDNESFQRQVMALLQWNSYDRLPEIKAPALILHGTADILVPPQNAEVLAERIPNAKLRLYEGVGHGLNAQVPHEVARDVIAHLQSDSVPM